jgi:hypothetical protein
LGTKEGLDTEEKKSIFTGNDGSESGKFSPSGRGRLGRLSPGYLDTLMLFLSSNKEGDWSVTDTRDVELIEELDPFEFI